MCGGILTKAIPNNNINKYILFLMYKLFNCKTALLYTFLIKNIVSKSRFYVFEKNIK